MKKLFWTLTTVGLLTGLFGCASTAEKQVQKEVAEQKAIETPAQAAASGRFAIRFSDKLSETQKTQFLNLMSRVQDQMTVLRTQEGQLKAALFQSLADGRYNQSEISVFKSKLKKLENKKLDIMFASLDEVRGILGKSPDPDRDFQMLDQFRSEMGL